MHKFIFNKLLLTCFLFIVFQIFLFLFFRSSVLAESVKYIHTDHLGSSSIITDEKGELVSNNTYYPYGNTNQEQGTSPTERKYTGQISDQDQTNLYYYNARYYNPTVGKFTQADKTHAFTNGYAYVNDNPIINIDPTGGSEKPPALLDYLEDPLVEKPLDGGSFVPYLTEDPRGNQFISFVPVENLYLIDKPEDFERMAPFMKSTPSKDYYKDAFSLVKSPEYLVIHWAGKASRENEHKFIPMATDTSVINRGTSVNFFCDKESCYQLTRFYENSLVGTAGGPSNKSVNVEMMGYYFDDPEHRPPESEIDNTVELVTQIMNKYNISFSKVVGHMEVTAGKPDPGVKFMEEFRSRLRENLEDMGLFHLIDGSYGAEIVTNFPVFSKSKPYPIME